MPPQKPEFDTRGPRYPQPRYPQQPQYPQNQGPGAPHWKPIWSLPEASQIKPFSEILKSSLTPAQKRAIDAAKDFFNLLPREACLAEGEELKGCYSREHKELFNAVGTKGGGVIRAGEMLKRIDFLQQRNDSRERRGHQVDEQEKQKLAAFYEAFANVPANFIVYR